MILNRLRVENYRNIPFADLSFDSGVNLLFGENAQGKTNALECIYSFARGKSFRSAKDEELVRFGEKGFSSEITFSDREREQTLSYCYFGGERKRLRNGVTLSKQTEMIGHFRAVLFYPEHLQLIKGGPSERRSFLNIAISQCYPAYLKLYGDYSRILENRNCLLKLSQKGLSIDKNELEIWSDALASAAASIWIYRKSYIEKLTQFASPLLSDISGKKEALSLSYESDVSGENEKEIREAYHLLFRENLMKEISSGCSLYGIHRDDLSVLINGISARSFASQGQQRSIVLSLKLAEGEVSRSLTGEYPVFLFDDVLSELDEYRRSYVLSDPGERQFIVTACEDSGFDLSLVHTTLVSAGSFRKKE